MEMIGTSGEVNGYFVNVLFDTVIVSKEGKKVTVQKVKGLQKFIDKAGDLKLGWAKLPDFEVIYIYDKSDNNFGYAVNLQDEWCSEWGYAPFTAKSD